MFNVALNAEILKGCKVRGAYSFLGKKKVAMEVTQRPNALVGVYIFPFRVGSKHDLLRRPHEPQIESYARGIPECASMPSSYALDVEFNQEEFERASKYF